MLIVSFLCLLALSQRLRLLGQRVFEIFIAALGGAGNTAALQAIGIKGEANTLDCATGLKPEAMEKPVDFVIRDSEPPKDDSKTTQSTDDSN